MTLLAVERIKLFSTRSPYWCLLAIVLAALLLPLAVGLSDDGTHADPTVALMGVTLGQDVFMIMAALAVTTEYRFGTMRTTFLASPRRILVLGAKTGLLAALGAMVGFVTSIAAFFLTKALAKNPPVEFSLTGEMWRVVAGHAALFAIAAAIAVAVGSLIRQSAGAIAILLLWPLLVENLVSLIPTVGPKIQVWLPFHAAAEFVTPTSAALIGPDGTGLPAGGPSPVGGLLLFLGYAAVLWLLAAVSLHRRDA